MRATWRESVSNIAGRPGLALLVFLVMCSAALGAADSEVAQLQSAWRTDAGLRAQGFTTMQLTGSGGVRLATSDCDTLSRLPGVLAGTWLGTVEDARLNSKQSVRVLPVGPGFPALVSVLDSTARSVWRGEQAFVDMSSALAASRHRSSQVELVDARGRGTRLNYFSADLTAVGPVAITSMIVVRAETDAVTSCIATVSEDERLGILASAAAKWPATLGYSVAWTLTGAENIADPRVQFDLRASRTTWILGVITATLVWALVLRIRRNDLAFYAIAGLPRFRIVAIFYTEYLLLAFSAAISVIGSIVIKRTIVHADSASYGLALTTSLRTLSVAMLWALIATLVLAPRADHHLITALKDR